MNMSVQFAQEKNSNINKMLVEKKKQKIYTIYVYNT